MNLEQRVVYYRDELKDEFAGDNITPKKIDGTYRYLRYDFWGRASHLLFYRIIAIPLAFLYTKLYFHHKIVNKSVLKQAKGQGYFIYGNHTHFLADALVPTMVNMPTEVSVIVHPNNVSMPVLGKITPSLGALPLPDDTEAARNFIHAIEDKIHRKKCVMVYPEAHIWPYYTGIRPFKDTSFRYPVQYHTPVFCLTNTYQKNKISKRPRMVTYIDGPFYPDSSLPSKEQKMQLRNAVYETMKERAKASNVVLIRYEKLQEQEEKEND